MVRRKNVYNVEGGNNESFSMKIIRRFQNLNSVTKKYSIVEKRNVLVLSYVILVKCKPELISRVQRKTILTDMMTNLEFSPWL